MRFAFGIVVWSAILLMAYRFAPRALPRATKLARFGIGCAALIIPAAIEMSINGGSGWSPQGTLATVLGVIAGIGMLVGMISGAIALILDGLRSSPR